MNRRHQERQESQERLIPPFAPTLTTSQVPFHLTLPATTSVKLLSAAESSQNLLNDDGQTTTGSRPSVGFNIDVNIYHYCDYNKKGLLLDLLDKHGDKGLAREFKLMTPFMYCSGKGLTIKESCVDFSCSQREQSKDFKKRKSPTTEYLASDKQEKEDQTDNFLINGLQEQKPFLTDSPEIQEKEDVVLSPNQLLMRSHVGLAHGTRRVCWKLGFRGLYGETLLHILIICNTEQHTLIAKELIRRFPALVHDVFESDEYYGTSGLHLSIAYRNGELIELLLQSGANIHQRASGNFFMPSDQQAKRDLRRPTNFSGLAYLGEYPLSWAACMDDKMTYNLLMRYGADPNLQDSFGNMILHVVVARERLMFYSFSLKHPMKQARDDIANVYGLTPLTMACLLGRDRIFAEIIELKCFEFWTYSIITCCGYPLDLIDSIQLIGTKDGISAQTDSNSALSLISSGSSDEHIEMLRGGIVQKLLEEKWKTFGYVKFTRSLLTTFVYLITLSLVVFLRSMRDPFKSSWPQEEEGQQNYFKSPKFWIRTAAEVITTIACLKLLLSHAMGIVAVGWTKYMKGLNKRIPLLVFTLSNILILLSFLLRLLSFSLNNYGSGQLLPNKITVERKSQTWLLSIEDAFLAMALPMSWFYLIFFAGGMKLTGPFVSMIRYMLIQDMRQFSVIYLIFIYAFSQAFYFLLKEPKGRREEGKFEIPVSSHDSYDKSWMELFRMTLGVWNYDELRSHSYYNLLSLLFFVLFLILVPILLLNMLIAMMGNTYSEIIGKSEREFALQWANILVEIERGLPKKEARNFVDQYTIVSKDADNPKTTLMVIKRMSKSKAKQRLEALANWKRLRWKLRTFSTSQDKSLLKSIS